jgi:hypothetical protein
VEPLTDPKDTGTCASTVTLPNFVIVGAMKSGTTSLARYLEAHHDVFMVPEKEVEFFDRFWDKGLAWYAQRFATAAGQTAIGEASPTYLADPVAITRLVSTLPDAKLIVLLRNPVDRAYSHYWHWCHQMGEQRSFERSVADELEHLAAGRSTGADGESLPRSNYVGDGHYLVQLERLVEHVPRKQLLVLLLDDLERQPEVTFLRVCDFLGVAREVPDCVGTPYNTSSDLRKYHEPAWLWNLMVRIQLGKVLPPAVGAWIWRRMVRFAPPYPPMDPSVRARLVEHFAPHNARLGAWLGRDLSDWSAAR